MYEYVCGPHKLAWWGCRLDTHGTGPLSHRVKQLMHEADRSPLSSSEVVKEWSSTSSHLHIFMGMVLNYTQGYFNYCLLHLWHLQSFRVDYHYQISLKMFSVNYVQVSFLKICPYHVTLLVNVSSKISSWNHLNLFGFLFSPWLFFHEIWSDKTLALCLCGTK